MKTKIDKSIAWQYWYEFKGKKIIMRFPENSRLPRKVKNNQKADDFAWLKQFGKDNYMHEPTSTKN